jgi:hypothetical protein
MKSPQGSFWDGRAKKPWQKGIPVVRRGVISAKTRCTDVVPGLRTGKDSAAAPSSATFSLYQTIRVFSPPDQGQMGAILGRPAPQDSWTESWVDRIDRELIWGDKPRGKTVGAQKPAAEHDASRALTYSLTRQDSFLLGTPKVWDECTSSFQLVRRGRSESPLAAANLGIRSAPAARRMSKTSSDLVLEDAS